MANAEPMANEEPKPQTGGGLGGAWEAVGPIIAALITGVGLLAFVAFFGGAILWDRADQAGLPGTQSVALMPRSTLLATGSHFLVWALVLSVGAVAVLWLLDTFLLRDNEEIETEAALNAAALAEKERSSDGQRDLAEFESGETKAVGKARRALVEAIRREKRAQARFVDSTRQAEEEDDLEPDEINLRHKAVALARANKTKRGEESRRAEEDLAREIARRDEWSSLRWRSVVLAGGLLVGELVILELVHPSLDLSGDYPWLVPTGVVTALLAVAVYHSTRKFFWFAVAAFLAVASVQAVATHYDITSEPRVEPAAVLIGRLPAITGVFVSQTDDRVYLGVSKSGVVGESAALVALPRNRVAGLAVGKLTRVREGEGGAMTFPATERATELWEILCSHVPETPKPKEKPAGAICPQT